MKSIEQSLSDMAGVWIDKMDAQEKAAVESILEDAKALVLEELDIFEFGRRSSGKMRAMALFSTTREDTRREALLFAINGLIRCQGFEITTCGVWSPEEITRGKMRLHPAREVTL